MTQHLGAQKLDHIRSCSVCLKRLKNMNQGGVRAVRLEKKGRNPFNDIARQEGF